MADQIQFKFSLNSPFSSKVCSDSDGLSFPELFNKNGDRVPFKDASEVSLHLARQCSSYHSILQDLRHAERVLQKCKSIPRDLFDDVVPSLFSDAIIIYGRCFNQGEGRTLNLSAQKPWVLGEEELQCHNRIMSFRNTLYAHVGENNLRKSETLIVFDSEDKPIKFNIFCRQRKPNNFSSQEHDEILKHISRIRLRLHEKLDNVITLLVKDIQEKLKLNYWPEKVVNLSEQ